jgi:hypothetical protein
MKHTLKAAIDAGVERISVYCITCVNSRDFTPDHALELWGTEATFPEIARRAKCRKCGQHASQAAPGWPPSVPGERSSPAAIPKGWENLETENRLRIPKRR